MTGKALKVIEHAELTWGPGGLAGETVRAVNRAAEQAGSVCGCAAGEVGGYRDEVAAEEGGGGDDGFDELGDAGRIGWIAAQLWVSGDDGGFVGLRVGERKRCQEEEGTEGSGGPHVGC